MEEIVSLKPLITNDAVVFGILMSLLMGIFYTAQLPGFKKFYNIIPTLLLCYFLPSIFNTLGIISPAWLDLEPALQALRAQGYQPGNILSLHDFKVWAEEVQLPFEAIKPFTGKSQLYYVASRYLLPASLILLTLSIDFKEILRLGPKALIMFITGTVGVVLGGPIALWLMETAMPSSVAGEGSDAVWRGMTTIAGSWIGGGANQAAMYEIFEPNSKLYSIMITVDVIVAEIWMAFLLFGVGRTEAIDRFFKADSSTIETLKNKMEEFSQRTARIASFRDYKIILGLAFGLTGLAHLVGDGFSSWISANAPGLARFSLTSGFFWLIVLSTTFGLILSFTKARNYEGAGASKIGSVFIYILVATIGMKMNILEIFDNPGLFLLGLIWMAFHVLLLVIVGKLIRAPFFLLAVGSKANIGGAASAPVVAAAFHPSLAPVGVLLAVLGYALGTYGAWLCGMLLQLI
jgi:uncharacterized membrane protein